MASYTIAHLKLSSTIAETGAKIENTRLGVYLTNSLEKAEIEVKHFRYWTWKGNHRRI